MKKHKQWSAKDYAVIGGLVGGAGVGNSAGFIGLSTTLTLLPFCVAAGVIGGLLWWGVRTVTKDI